MTNFLFVMLTIAAFVIVLVGGLVWVGSWDGRLRKQDPEELLKMRFVKGEIDEKEYARRLSILRYGPPMELPD